MFLWLSVVTAGCLNELMTFKVLFTISLNLLVLVLCVLLFVCYKIWSKQHGMLLCIWFWVLMKLSVNIYIMPGITCFWWILTCIIRIIVPTLVHVKWQMILYSSYCRQIYYHKVEICADLMIFWEYTAIFFTVLMQN